MTVDQLSEWLHSYAYDHLQNDLARATGHKLPSEWGNERHRLLQKFYKMVEPFTKEEIIAAGKGVGWAIDDAYEDGSVYKTNNAEDSRE